MHQRSSIMSLLVSVVFDYCLNILVFANPFQAVTVTSGFPCSLEARAFQDGRLKSDVQLEIGQTAFDRWPLVTTGKNGTMIEPVLNHTHFTSVLPANLWSLPQAVTVVTESKRYQPVSTYNIYLPSSEGNKSPRNWAIQKCCPLRSGQCILGVCFFGRHWKYWKTNRQWKFNRKAEKQGQKWLIGQQVDQGGDFYV